MPCEIAFVKDNAPGVVMSFGDEVHVPAEMTSLDWTYQTFSWDKDGVKVTCEWG